MNEPKVAVEKVAVDIEDMVDGAALKLKSVLIANGGTVFRTKRGRLSVLISKKNFDSLEARFKFKVEDGFDGTVLVAPSEVAAA